MQILIDVTRQVVVVATSTTEAEIIEASEAKGHFDKNIIPRHIHYDETLLL